MSDNVTIILTDLMKKGIAIQSRGDRLSIKAPEGVLTEAVRAQIVANKEEILKHLPQANDETNPAQAGDVIQWVSPLFGPSGPAKVLARSGSWLLVERPSSQEAAPIVHDTWQVNRTVGNES